MSFSNPRIIKLTSREHEFSKFSRCGEEKRWLKLLNFHYKINKINSITNLIRYTLAMSFLYDKLHKI